MKQHFVTRITKITLFAALMFTTVAASAFAKPSTVGSTLKRSFETQFKDASNVNWKITDNFTKASCTLNNENVEIFYGSNDEYVGMSKSVFLESLPQASVKTVLTKYKEYKIKSVIKFMDADEVITYYVQLDNSDKSIILKADTDGHTDVYKEDSKF